jgi:flavin-dependent dehydrogenase
VSWDAVIVGGGPAGLACAIEVALRGLSTVVLERAPEVPDKACGEGLMPAGVRALERLQVLERIDPASRMPFHGIRYLQEDGASVEALFREGPGLGVRRTALVAALADRARALGVDIRWGSRVLSHERSRDSVRVRTTEGELVAKVLVAADGLGSEIRRAAGLERRALGAGRRFGMRRHFRVEPWSSFVEVHWGENVEAYVTPVGPDQVGLAFLWDRERWRERASFDRFLAEFPVLAARLDGASAESSTRGAGPLARAARSRVARRLVLVGDAAGYVDAITGEGLSLAFACAGALGEILPRALPEGATARALAAYERAFLEVYRPYAVFTRGVLLLSSRPWLRRRIVRALATVPGAFEALLGVATTLSWPRSGRPSNDAKLESVRDVDANEEGRSLANPATVIAVPVATTAAKPHF